jgi:hypothetical protein
MACKAIGASNAARWRGRVGASAEFLHPFKGLPFQAEAVAVEIEAFADDTGISDTTALLETHTAEVDSRLGAPAMRGGEGGDFGRGSEERSGISDLRFGKKAQPSSGRKPA